MSEGATIQRIRLELGRVPGLKLFRNNCGALPDQTGRIVRYGVASPGGSDLIGFRTVTITPEMVGQRLAVFAACEVKAPGGKHPVTPEQAHFIEVVQAAGGLAGVARNAGQARHILGLPPT
jgi:hypothetical protein